MAEPLPPDPYAALGVAKDADTLTIKKAHRKLVLTHHPDKIQDPVLKEKGKDEFHKIQQAYELLVDANSRARYDDQVRLAQLRKEAMMMRDTPPTHVYPMRPPPYNASSSREWDSDEHRYYEVRRPRNPDFDSKEKFEDPNRSSSRKHPDYDRTASSKKASERERSEKSAKAAWGVAYAAVNAGLKFKKEAEKAKSKKNESKQETRDREKRKARQEKEQRTKQAFVVDADSDSDTATRVTGVTESTIRPSRPSPRPTQGAESASKRHSDVNRQRSYSSADSDVETTFSTNTKWESHHDKSKEYIAAAAASAGKRPSFQRNESGSYWNSHRRSGSESEQRPASRPTSSRGRNSYEEMRQRPPMPQQNSSPANLKTRVDERSTKERRSATGPYPSRDRERDLDFDHRKEMPTFSRSKTMPTPKPSSKKDSMPSKSSNLKHAETHDSGYGSSSSPHTPELREDSPSRRPKQSSTRYQVVDPAESDSDRQTRIRILDDDSDHRRRRTTQSPEPTRRDSDRRREKSDRSDRPERPSINTRSKTSRDTATETPRLRRAETSSRYDGRSPRESPRETPNISRHNSAREKMFGEVSDDERQPSKYKYPSTEKVNVRGSYGEPVYANYGRETPDRRSHDFIPSSRFQDDLRQSGSRRPSVY